MHIASIKVNIKRSKAERRQIYFLIHYAKPALIRDRGDFVMGGECVKHAIHSCVMEQRRTKSLVSTDRGSH